MTFEQTTQIMEVLETAYPQFYNGKYAPDRKKAIALWAKMFEDDDARLVTAAVTAIIKANKGAFPPSIGDISAKMQELSQPDTGMTEQEAWSLVSKALQNGCYGAKEEFEKLPPILQSVVHSPNQLREWALMDAETVQSVVSSNFQRSYRAKKKTALELSLMPSNVKALVSEISSGFQLPDASGDVSEHEFQKLKNEAERKLVEHT